MSARSQLVVLAGCALVVGASFAVLRWTGDRLEDLEPFTRGIPSEAGRLIEHDEFTWLDHRVDRTRVEPEPLRAALAELEGRLRSELALPLEGAPHPLTADVEIPRGWNESELVGVLIGAQGRTEVDPGVDPCSYAREMAGVLAAMGWQLRVGSHDAIQTTYPLVTPAPQRIELEGRSPLGEISVSIPPEGTGRFDYAVTETSLADHNDVDPADPPIVPCSFPP